MRSESSYNRRFLQPYRHPWELGSALFWTLNAGYCCALYGLGFIGFTISASGFALNMCFACWRLVEGWRILRARSYLHGYCIGFMSMQELAKLTKYDEIWLGSGFVWHPAHSQKLYDLSRCGFRKWRLGKFFLFLSGRSKEAQPDSEQGLASLHGLNSGEYDLYRPFQNFEGGTAVVGTTQAGKGVVLNVLIAQAILRGDTVLIFDPKGSERLWNSVCCACRVAKRPEPYFFTTEADGKGVRLNPLNTWTTSGEIATRIVSVMTAGSDDVFRAYAWSAIDTVAGALIHLDYSPTISLIEFHINAGIQVLLAELLDKHVQEFAENDWKAKARSFMPPRARDTSDQVDELLLKISWYQNVLPNAKKIRVIDAALKVFYHSKEHYSKITSSLIPCFAMLNNGDLQNILSPNPMDDKDQRQITSIEKIIVDSGVLYVSMGSLQNADVASAVGAIFLADLAAVAGKRYQIRKKDRRIALFVDEVSNVLNVPLIEILNKGAEGGIYATCAMQTMADLEVRMNSKAAARKVIGNLNNVIALRTKDGETRDVFTESLGKTYIHQIDTSLSTHSDSVDGIPTYKAGASHKRSSQREDIVPAEYFSMLPNCQYFGMVSAGMFIKGRVPILFDAEEVQKSTKSKAELKNEDQLVLKEALELFEEPVKQKGVLQ
ncbi:MAG: conjugative transfer system coupling protein TraD [Burkholderiales bacterium]|nr:conjugative transfer system coupling protein TraD [Burkholderiales bacterium]